MDEWHATRLVDYVVNLAGKVILIVTVLMVAGAFAAGATGNPTWLGVAGLVSTLGVGVMLWMSQAPAPRVLDEVEES